MELKLREEILKQLKESNPCQCAQSYIEMMQSPQGYEQVEQMVINKVLHDQMVPAAVIPLIRIRTRNDLMDITSPIYLRARIDMIRDVLSKSDAKDFHVALLRNGVYPKDRDEKGLVEIYAKAKRLFQ